MEVGEWKKIDEESKKAWEIELEEFKAAKKAEREKRHAIKMEINRDYERKAVALRRYKGLMAAKRRWHTNQWKLNEITNKLAIWEEESKEWPTWTNMDQVYLFFFF